MWNVAVPPDLAQSIGRLDVEALDRTMSARTIAPKAVTRLERLFLNGATPKVGERSAR
jgi:hypothetical protein